MSDEFSQRDLAESLLAVHQLFYDVTQAQRSLTIAMLNLALDKQEDMRDAIDKVQEYLDTSRDSIKQLHELSLKALRASR